MDTILITYGTRPFAQRVGKLLSSRYIPAYASAEPFPDVLLNQHYHRIPTGANPTFAHEMLKLCLDCGYQMVLPLGKMEQQPLRESRILFEEYGITLLSPLHHVDYVTLESPSGEMHVFASGKNLLTGEVLNDDDQFSGVGILSDSGNEPIWCLV